MPLFNETVTQRHEKKGETAKRDFLIITKVLRKCRFCPCLFLIGITGEKKLKKGKYFFLDM